MNSNRNAAIIVGILFIIGTVSGILSVAFTGTILTAPNYLVKISSNEFQMTIGALSVLIMGFTLAMVPIIMYPIFKRYNRILALGYVIFRGALETVTYILIGISILLLYTLSKEYVNAGAPDVSYFQTLGVLLLRVRELGTLNTIFVFGLGALMFNYLLYQSNLIPRWISVWGLIAITSHLATGLLIMFGLQTEMTLMNTIMNIPIFLQEMVMAVWLIAKGFNPLAFVSGSSK